ncbi:MAG: transporter substrate-binding domain-containing protein [Hydrotalea sp.]|nr:transporter substrate-binding domain-containing protein [Hydrotalea sp.]
MKNIKLLLLSAVAVLCAHAGYGAKQAQAAGDSLKICVEGGSPPYNQLSPNGEIVGFDVDIGRALLKKMGKKYDMVKMDWDGMIPALKAKKCDAIISSMAITEERKKRISFTDPYYASPPERFAAKKGKFPDDKPETLKGKTIGVQRATIAEEFLKEKYPEVKLKSYATQNEANADLLDGRVDAIFQDVVPTKDFLKTKEAIAANIALFGVDHRDVKILGPGAGIGVRQEDEDLRKSFNKAIKAIHASGEYKTINDKYFDFDISK